MDSNDGTARASCTSSRAAAIAGSHCLEPPNLEIYLYEYWMKYGPAMGLHWPDMW